MLNRMLLRLLTVGALLALAVPAWSVTRSVLSTDCSPGNVLLWSKPAATGGTASTGYAYVGTQPFRVWAVQKFTNACTQGEGIWSNYQQLLIDWHVYYWALGKWNDWPLGVAGETGPQQVWVNAYGPNYSYLIQPRYFRVPRGFSFAVVMRIGWAYGGSAMAAATYYFDQYGDLFCQPVWYNCVQLNGVQSSPGWPHNSTQALYIY